MAENTTVGPAGSNHAPFPLTNYPTYGHTDDYNEGTAVPGTNEGSTVGPDPTGWDFPGAHNVGVNGVEPGNGAPGWDVMTGPVEPTGFDPGDNLTDGVY